MKRCGKIAAIMAQTSPSSRAFAAGPAAQSDRRSVWWALLAVLAGFVALQLWRPFYFLNDDNMSGLHPVVVTLSRQLWSGQTPFVVPQLFGGYDLLRDPAGLCFWNPFWLLLSPLALTRWNIALVDCYALLQLLLGAFCMAHLLIRVRQLFRPELSDARIAFLTFSYVFSIWMIVTTPNWITFQANQAALPLFFLGFWHPRRRTGIFLVVCAFFQSVVVGHPNSFVLSLFFLATWMAAQALLPQREATPGEGMPIARWQPVQRFAAGGAIAGVLLAPLLILALSGFFKMGRSNAEDAAFTSLLAMPGPVFFTSYFSGYFASFFGEFGLLFVPNGLSSAIVFTPATLWIFHSLNARRKLTPTEIAFGVTAAVVALCVIRPLWLTQIFSAIPMLRSTRIPFREVFAFLFFVHLWIALRPVGASRLIVQATTLIGILIYTVSLGLFRPPAFTPMPLDRQLILSGEANAYWAKVRAVAAPGRGLILPVIPAKIPVPDRAVVPWTLMNAYNYPALSGLHSRSGYVIRNMLGSRYAGTQPLGPIGCFYLKDLPRLRAADPNLRFLVLRSTDPVRIELWDGARHTPLPVPDLPRVSENRWDLIPR